MHQTAIFYPVLALVMWTMLVLLLMPYRRFKAAFSGTVTPADFRYGESAKVPPEVSLPNRAYMNLLEAPMLFYVVCVVLFELKAVSPLALKLAWAYVVLRVLHSLIHLIYNNVFHRLTAFAASSGVLVALWVCALMGLQQAG
ncbi:MAPEG family protein [Solimonas marina]|uniref:MAPEG family protein n=1 Tax=Solimonas marina TaxID=2714601 RepID=A0A969W784_9GAMM|nr:MAPEG family protein [Solimonas marina]NKF20875.1 hypothetical protein [Solimonas marina]